MKRSPARPIGRQTVVLIAGVAMLGILLGVAWMKEDNAKRWIEEGLRLSLNDPVLHDFEMFVKSKDPAFDFDRHLAQST